MSDKKTPREIAKSLLYKHFGAYFNNQSLEDLEQAIAAEREWQSAYKCYHGKGNCHDAVSCEEGKASLIEENRVLAEALKNIPTRLTELSQVLRKAPGDEAIRIAEHDACLIAIGFLKSDFEKASTQTPLTEKHMRIFEAKERVVESIRIFHNTNRNPLPVDISDTFDAIAALEAAEKEI